jgi:hypothetical protein
MQVMTVAKDQNGCRFLQRKFDEGGPAAIQAVLPEVLEHLIDLMMDPFGNYLVQKLLDRCSEEQRLAVRCRRQAVGLPVAPEQCDACLAADGCFKLPSSCYFLSIGPAQIRSWFVQVIKKAAERKELVQVALNTHGTRAVQKLIETLTSREQVCTPL